MKNEQNNEKSVKINQQNIFSEPVTTYARLAVEALEKQNPKEVINQGINCKSGNWTIICPDCNTSIESPRKMAKYCPNCGQALKWSDNDGD